MLKAAIRKLWRMQMKWNGMDIVFVFVFTVYLKYKNLLELTVVPGHILLKVAKVKSLQIKSGFWPVQSH